MTLRTLAASRLMAASMVVACGAAGANASIINGGFETGDLTGWTTSGVNPATNDQINVFFSAAQAGSYGVYAFSAEISTLTQQVNTVPNQWYILSFWVANDPSIEITTFPNHFSAVWDGQELMSITNGPAGDYVNHQFYVYSTDSSTPLDFNFQHPGRIWALDSVTLTRTNVPAPGVAGVAALVAGAGLRRRRLR